MNGSEGAAGSGPQVAGQERVVRKNTSLASYERSVVQVHAEFDQLDPGAISGACTTWKKAADELFALAEDLKVRVALPLAAVWQSPSSPGAQAQLQGVEATARALANDCLAMAHATDYAAQYAQWYKENLPSYGDALVAAGGGVVDGKGLSGGAEQAVTHMVRLLGRYNEVLQILPDSVKASVMTSFGDVMEVIPPPPPLDDGYGGVPGGVGATAGGVAGEGGRGGSVGTGVEAGGLVTGAHGVGRGAVGGVGLGAESGAGDVGGVAGMGGTGTSGGGGPALDPYAAGTSLAGAGGGGRLASFDPAGAGGLGAAAGGSGAVGLGAGALGAAGVGVAGLGAGGLASGRGGAGLLPGAGGAGSGMLGAGAGVAPGGVVGGPAAAGGAGMVGGMPMGGGSGSGGEEERERSTWLLEDEDVWAGDGEAPPPVIGG